MLSGKREPLYAGSWYEAEPDRLRYQLGTLLERAEPLVDPASQELLSAKTTVPAADGPVLAIVAPHAGYMFSGQAAAHSWKAISNHQVERLVLLGPSHHVGLTGAALPSAATFSTPLGDLAVDSHLVGELRDCLLYTSPSPRD